MIVSALSGQEEADIGRDLSPEAVSMGRELLVLLLTLANYLKLQFPSVSPFTAHPVFWVLLRA